ncbi:hypothetical protein [Segetibacter aerophilus]|uniref:Lipoprotein n=1 Tax=Segetibacter aerophilus TaxID=670293 RepID=A0A512BGE6_9BACT|nr:hypothetical protein [Segetibacter aerophilus]GEO11041.1 hypothetical protein SAE01_35370 [Segetibacter aerophilus]
MKKALLPIYFIAAAILVTACKKETAADPPANNFGPSTTGSNWTYKYTEGTASTTFKLTATNRDTTANGKTYKVYTSSDGSTTYMGKIGSDYYRFASFPSIGVNSFEELYLKDDKGLNDTWTGTASFTYLGANLTANLNYAIKGKGESRTVNGKLFDNVTHVRLDISLFGTVVGGGDFYYAQGVGLIEDTIAVTAPGAQPYTSKQEIISYEIK